MFDVAAVRRDFPIFANGLAYLDSANTSQRPRQVTGAMMDYFGAHDGLEGACDVITSAAMFYDLDDPNTFVADIVKCLSPTGVWINPRMRREKVDLPWMAGERISFLGPLQYEWFLMWWDAYQKHKPGGREPADYVQPREILMALDDVKEQMLIRRDVKKDENPPEEQEFFTVEVGQPMAALEKTPALPVGIIATGALLVGAGVWWWRRR